MFDALLTALEDEVAVVERMIAVNELSRSAVSTGSPGGDFRDEVARIAPGDTDWRLYDHCAAIMRLYAVYEEFVLGAVGEWVTLLPDLYGPYGDLPEAVRKAYRVGTAEILSKVGGDRYAHLAEDQVIQGLADGLSGGPYALGPDAFLTDDRNLRQEKLQRVFQQIGIAEPWDRISTNRDVARWEQTVSADQTTLAAELSLFISYRNEAAHGSVGEILSAEGLRSYAFLVRLIAHAITDAVTGEHIDQLERAGKVHLVGRVIREFSDNVLGIETTDTIVSVGQMLMVRDARTGFISPIESLQIDRVSHDAIECPAGTKIGVKLTRSARIGADVWMVPSGAVGVAPTAAALSAQVQADDSPPLETGA